MAAVVVRHRRRAERNFRERITPEYFSEEELMSRYRVNRATLYELALLCENDLRPTCNRGKPVPVVTQVMSSMRLLAKGDFYSEVADLHGFSKSTMCCIFHRFIDSINNNLETIRFPLTQDEILSTKLAFYRACRLPGVIGAIDGTHIPIKTPHVNPLAYVCRKGFHSINVQAVVNSNMMFTDIVATWPGSQHDAASFNCCGLKTHMETNDVGFLLGDSGYPLREYLMVPMLQPTTQQQLLYNAAHIKGRQCVERAFGIMKSRFRCLHKSGGHLPFEPGKCCKVIEACARLHNLCKERGIPDPPQLIAEEEEALAIEDCSNSGKEARQRLINLF